MEYEYCYKVSDLKEYLEYIKNYDFKETYKENRVIYRNNENNTISRITYKNDLMFLDFKENKISDNDLIERKESKTIKFDDLENCEDILNFLNYKKDNTIIRNRSIYQGDKIKFEIDEYLEPEKAFVLSFEGDKNTCDFVNKELEKLNKKYKI